MCTDDLEVGLTLERSEHPDDRRLPQPLADLSIQVRVMPRQGDLLELPWPISNDPEVPATTRAHARVAYVEHYWIDGDVMDGGERIPVFAARITATLLDPDLTDGPWE